MAPPMDRGTKNELQLRAGYYRAHTRENFDELFCFWTQNKAAGDPQDHGCRGGRQLLLHAEGRADQAHCVPHQNRGGEGEVDYEGLRV